MRNQQRAPALTRRTLLRFGTATLVAVGATTALGLAAAGEEPGDTARWLFDEESGATARESVSGRADQIAYVFNDARFKPDSDPLRRPGVLGRALYFDGYSTWIDAPDPGTLDVTAGLTIEAWAAPYAYEHGIDGKPQALVNQHDPQAHRGFLLGIHRFGQVVFRAGFGESWAEVRAAADRPLAKGRWSHLLAVFDPAADRLTVYLDGEPIGTAATPAGRPLLLASGVPLRIGKHNDASVVGGVFGANTYSGLLDQLAVRAGALDAAGAARRYADAVAALPGGAVPRPDLAPDRRRYDGDRHRPQYHMVPPAHWMNEPHAPLYFRGQYHLFYQHNPFGPYWGQIHWGHAVSEDLVHWRDLPVALAPGRETMAPDGVWSGSAAVDGDRPVLFYTGGDDRLTYRQRTGLAESRFPEDGDPDLTAWRMRPEPVTEAPAGLAAGPGVLWAENFRDPFVWQQGGTWYQLVGSGVIDRDGDTVTRKHGGAAPLYTAPAPEGPWTYRGPLFHVSAEAHPTTGEVWELPVLLPLPGPDGTPSGKHIFLENPWWERPTERTSKHTLHWVGRFDPGTLRFEPDHPEPREFDLGEHFTGPSGLVTPDGRTVLFTIAQDPRPGSHHHASGWAHNAGLPVSLTLRPDGAGGTVGVAPVAETDSLRGEQLLSLRDVSPEEANSRLSGVGGDLLEIDLVLRPGGAGLLTLLVRSTPDGAEQTRFTYDTARARFSVDRDRSSLDPEVAKGVQGGPAPLTDGELRLRLFLDRSLLEAYLGGARSLTTRVYPTRGDSMGLRLETEGGTPRVVSLDVWRMNGAYGAGVVPPYYPG